MSCLKSGFCYEAYNIVINESLKTTIAACNKIISKVCAMNLVRIFTVFLHGPWYRDGIILLLWNLKFQSPILD